MQSVALIWPAVQRACVEKARRVESAEREPISRTEPRFSIGRFYHLQVVVFSWPRHLACGILIPRPGKEPTSPAVHEPCLTTGPSGMCPFSVLKLRLY